MAAKRSETRNTLDGTSDLGYLGSENDLDEGFSVYDGSDYERSLEPEWNRFDRDAPSGEDEPGLIRRPANYGYRGDIRRN